MHSRFSHLLTLVFLFSVNLSYAQTGNISGIVRVDNRVQELATVSILNDAVRYVSTKPDGSFDFKKIPFGSYTLSASFIGFQKKTLEIIINETSPSADLNFNLDRSLNSLDEVVITGTKTYKRQTSSPVIVNVINSQSLDDLQTCALSDGLRFQPGLRVETNCQTCNYTQLRLNGLQGGYSQILINGRPIFSPLMGLYGLEQLPKSMIDRIEVVRGGGSSLYGSSAIGGTVNIITKVPKINSYELNSFYQNINGKSNDLVLSGNASIVGENKNSGMSFFFNNRGRDLYDHNEDNFSEIPKIENLSLGINMFFLPNENQKIELSLSNLNEYRYGGEMIDKPAYLTGQSEERNQNTWMGTIDHQINFNDENTSLITYGAMQSTNRKHYTGILPDDSIGIIGHMQNPPYGTSQTTTLQVGVQLNHRLKRFIVGSNTLTFGSEYILDDVFDEIPSYQYEIDQRTTDLGMFLQSDWQLLNSINLLSGVRMDKHNLVSDLIFSPRISMLYKIKTNTQFRLNFGTGFRAPQSFDTDLHIAFAGGGVSRISLSPQLSPEKSQSLSASINYDKPKEHFILGFTLEGFYTRLNNAFYLEPIGSDDFGALFEKRNGQGATVQGITVEFRANYDKKAQFESGLTLQSSQFDNKVQYIENLEGIKGFIRTPASYGFATLTFMPNKKVRSNVNYIYTGSMNIPHFSGAPNQLIDEMITSRSYSELSLKTSYTLSLVKMETEIELYSGIKNIFNSYQNNFDVGKNRDSNFVFGPSFPRTFFIGMKFLKR
ncbi:MAG: Colicin I receptor [Owenweeksia sp. TMED14]|nr:MAG: Colicin I receptor [Owenweeksia sp. TMED14]